MARGSSPNRKQMVKEGTLKYQKGRKNTVSKNMGKYNRLFFLEFLKLYLMVEENIGTLSDVVLHI